MDAADSRRMGNRHSAEMTVPSVQGCDASSATRVLMARERARKSVRFEGREGCSLLQRRDESKEGGVKTTQR